MPQKSNQTGQGYVPEYKTVVRTLYDKKDFLRNRSRLHQGSALCQFLCVVILTSEEVKEGSPRELLFALDLDVIEEREEGLQENWLKWQ